MPAMTTSEYLAVAAGLLGVWHGVEQVTEHFAVHSDALTWTLAIPF
jgi:hypothetical protein